MAAQIADMTINLDIEPSEKARAFVRQVVIETLEELVKESPWLEERVNACIERAFARQVRLLRTNTPTRGAT